jgi:hypothetical protein
VSKFASLTIGIAGFQWIPTIERMLWIIKKRPTVIENFVVMVLVRLTVRGILWALD